MQNSMSVWVEIVKWKEVVFYVDLIQEFNLKWKIMFPRWKFFIKIFFSKGMVVVWSMNWASHRIFIALLFLCMAHWFFDTRKQFLGTCVLCCRSIQPQNIMLFSKIGSAYYVVAVVWNVWVILGFKNTTNS